MVSKIKLPKLEKKEEVAVTSRVVDVFYNPPTKKVNPVIGELARSLSGVIPQLQAYENVQEETEQTEQEAKADIDFRNENIKDFRELVKAGKIKEGANPYYIKQYIKNSLREKARDFEALLWDEYEKQEIKSNINPTAFNDFYKQFASDYAAKNNLSLYDNVSIAEGFIPYVDASRSSLQNQHINGRIAEIEKDNKENLRKLTEGIIFDNQDIDEEELDRALVNYPNLDNLDYEAKKTLFIAQSIQNELDELSLNVADMKPYNDLVVEKIIDIAKAAGNEDLLDILQNVVTDKEADSRLAGSYQEDILTAIFDIQQIQDNRELAALRKIQTGKQLRKEETLNYFVYNDTAMFDIEKAMDEYNFTLATQGQPRLSYEEKVALRNLSSSYIAGLQKENIIPSKEGTDFIVQLNSDLATNPQDPTIIDRIRLGLDNRYYSTDDFKTYMSTYFSRSKIESSPYFTDLRFNTELGNFDRSAGALAKELGYFAEDAAELVAAGKNQLLGFAYGMLEDLLNPEFLAQQKLITENQKRNYFFAELEKERKRIVDIVIPEMGDKRPETDLIEKSIKEGNIYAQ